MAILGNTKVTNLTLLDGVVGNLNPVTTGVYDLGTSSLKWRTLYGNAETATKLSTTGTTAKFWRGDNSWSDTLSGTAAVNTALLKLNASGALSSGNFTWGISHLVPNLAVGGNTAGISTGTASSVGNSAYFGFHNEGSNNDGNYVSIGMYGYNHLMTINKSGNTTVTGGLEIKGHIAGDTGTTGHGLWSGGGYHNAYNNIILHGDASTGSSGIAFISDKGTTTINLPSDRAFIQWHGHGVTTYTAENVAPTLATSGENNILVIGVGNDVGDLVRILTPSRTGLLHLVAATAYVIPDTNNTTGTVGSGTQPVWVDGGIIKNTTYTLGKSVPSDAVFTDTTSFTITANATDGMWDLTGTNGENAVTYALAPYSAQLDKASFDTSTTNPTRTDRLNYNGYLYATKLYSGGAEVLTSHLSLSGYIPKSTLSGAYDIMYSSAANTPTRLAANTTTTKKFLRMTGTGSAGAAPAWDTVTKSDVGLGNVDNTADANKTVKYANMLTGFNSQSSNFTWGNLTGTAITVMNDSSGGSIGFRKDNPASGQMSMCIDGTVYIKEGATNIADAIKSITRSGTTFTYTTLWGNTGTFTQLDTAVTQTNLTGNNDYRILLSGLANDTTATEGANKNTNLRFNPSSLLLSVGGSISATGDLTITGNADLNGETYADSVTAGSLLVNGAASFVLIPTAPTPEATSNDTSVATTAFVMNAFTANDAMVFKGVVAGSSSSPGGFTVAANRGDTYKVSTAGYVNGVKVEIGDMFICITDNTAAATSSNYSTIQNNWVVILTNIDGAVTGPTSATDGKVALFNGTTGKLIKLGTISTATVIKTVTLTGGVAPTLGTAFNVPNVTGNDNVTASKVTKSDNIVVKTISLAASTSSIIGSVTNGVLTFTQAITAVGAVTAGSTATASEVTITDVSASKITLGTAFSIPNVTNVGSSASLNTTTLTVVTGIS